MLLDFKKNWWNYSLIFKLVQNRFQWISRFKNDVETEFDSAELKTKLFGVFIAGQSATDTNAEEIETERDEKANQITKFISRVEQTIHKNQHITCTCE